jgi:hypothetical protein
MNDVIAPDSVRDKVIRLETRMDYLERETVRQTKLLEEQDARMRRIEKIMWALLGAVAVLDFGLKLYDVLSKGH